MSYVCPIHEQYVPDDKRCPYCVEPEAQPETYVLNTSIWFDKNAATSVLKELWGPTDPLIIKDIP